jgi:D-hexose-6-phosphate mutarotase
MTSLLPIRVVQLVRAAAGLALTVAALSAPRPANACETLADLHIDVATKFETAQVREDYTLADITTLAHQQHRDSSRALLGFYASEFGYTVDLVLEGDQACPRQIESTVTLRLQHRLIEIGREAATNSCMYPVALRHYRRLAEIDEQTVERFGARTAAALTQASSSLKEVHAPRAEDLDAALREQIRAVVDAAIVPLHEARQDAQQAVNNATELRQVASSCSI